MPATAKMLSHSGVIMGFVHPSCYIGCTFLDGHDVSQWDLRWTAEGIGGSLIASGIAGVSLFLYVSFTDTLRAQIETISKAGLSTIFSGRSVQIRDGDNTGSQSLAKLT